MKSLITILILFFSISAAAQEDSAYAIIPICDSVKLKVTKVRTLVDDKQIIWMKDKKAKIKYVTVCECGRIKKYHRRDIIWICRTKLEIIRIGVSKRDLGL